MHFSSMNNRKTQFKIIPEPPNYYNSLEQSPLWIQWPINSSHHPSAYQHSTSAAWIWARRSRKLLPQLFALPQLFVASGCDMNLASLVGISVSGTHCYDCGDWIDLNWTIRLAHPNQIKWSGWQSASESFGEWRGPPLISRQRPSETIYLRAESFCFNFIKVGHRCSNYYYCPRLKCPILWNFKSWVSAPSTPPPIDEICRE